MKVLNRTIHELGFHSCSNLHCVEVLKRVENRINVEGCAFALINTNICLLCEVDE